MRAIVLAVTNILSISIIAACARNSGGGTNLLPPASQYALPERGLPGVSGDQVLYSFQGGKDGVAPSSTLVADSTGALFGTTYYGGGSAKCSSPSGPGCGTVFKLTPGASGYSETILYQFKGGKDGAQPYAGLTALSGGVLFGTTQFGGSGSCSNPYGPPGCGTVFALTPSKSGYAKTTIYSFHGGSDGANPLGDMILDKGGVLYGTTQLGGSSNCNIVIGSGCGTVFKLTPSGSGYVEKIVYAFTGAPDGESPYGKLLVAAKGRFFGTTAYGANTGCGLGCGAVFELAHKQGAFSERVLYRFKGDKDGAWPKGSLIADSAGALYGITESGGGTLCTNYRNVNGCGIVFKLTPSGGAYHESVLYRFKIKTGAWSYSSLVSNSKGRLYGTAEFGGSSSASCPVLSYTTVYGCGTLFSLTGSGKYYTERTLDRFGGGADGAYPNAGLILVKGFLYGTTTNGGSGNCSAPYSGCGTVFRFNP